MDDSTSRRAAPCRGPVRMLSACAMMGAIGALAASLVAQPTQPVNGPRQVDPGWHALVGATLIPAPGARIENATIVVRHGVIQSVREGGAAPEGARVWDYADHTIYAGLIEPFAEVDAPDPSEDSPGTHWNKHIKAQRSALDGEGLSEEARKKLREMGYGAAMISPKGGIFRGTTALVSLGEEEVVSDPLARVIVPEICHAAGLDTSRGWGGSYPGSKMGSIAMARQVLADCRWRASAMEVYLQNPGEHERPAPDDACDALRLPLRILWDVGNELDVLRVARIAHEFDRICLIVGSGNEFKRLDVIAQLECPLIVPLAYPETPKVGTWGEREAVSLEALMSWEAAPTNAARLLEAGATVALTSSKVDKKQDFFSNLRLAIEGGLAEDDALAMLTTTPAQILGASDRLGTVEAGKIANLVVVDGTLFDEKREIRDVWVDGERYEVKAKPAVELEGEWSVALEVGGEIGTIAGTLKVDDKNAITFVREKLAKEIEEESKKSAEDKEEAEGAADDDGQEEAAPERRRGRRAEHEDNEKSFKAKGVRLAERRLDFQLDGKAIGLEEGTLSLASIAGDELRGIAIAPGPHSFEWKATRSDTDDDDGEDDDAEHEDGDDDDEDDEGKRFAGVPGSFGYPFGPYMMNELPEQPDVLVVRNATIWTAGPEGIIEDGELVIESGTITYVGAARRTQLPQGAVVIDAVGKHVTPGLIDCHSHTGISGGANEGGQAITSEVRIGDVINPDHIGWYRELAGGLTAVNQLHGSANPIGGQNAVTKIRWGVSDPYDMHLEGAIGGIKFALGENVKRSRGNREQTRYPSTRMGVETIMRDRFVAAQEYAQAWDEWNALSESRRAGGVPPRRDLELEALAEILAGDRLIHCHSYRQDEILMLCRLAGEFGFTIGTFQHVLEGYKVAEAIKEHALGGSSFSDWWAYKMEVIDAIPYNGAIMHDVGVTVTFNSDSNELARRMNTEAAKAVKYGGVDPHEALKFVTLNAAKQLMVEDQIGSLEAGKDGDFVIWSGDPLSSLSRCESTWVDGREYFSLAKDAAHRQRIASERERIVQKILASSGGAPKMAAGGGDDRMKRFREMMQRRRPTGLGDDRRGAWFVPLGDLEPDEARDEYMREELARQYFWMIENGMDPYSSHQGDCGCADSCYFGMSN